MNSDRIPKKMLYSLIRNFSETFVEILVENCQLFVRSIFHECLTRSFKLLSITLEVSVFLPPKHEYLEIIAYSICQLLLLFVSDYYSCCDRILTK
jgi:hypothetical protein